MTDITKETIDLLELLPEDEQVLINDLVKKLVRAWDSDFTKVTESEKADIESALEDDETFSHDEVWK